MKKVTSEDYDTSNLENGEDDIFQDEKMTITLTTTDNQKNNSNNNVTIIDLGECEILLRKEYNIPEDEIIYMKKIDLIQEGMKIPKVEYDVYCKLSGTNLIKLNLSICENSQISLSVPVVLSENLDKLNSSSGYYNDICYTATSDSGTDISLKDRKNEFIEGNKTVCQDDCDFSEYDYNTQKAKCTCKVKESSSSIFDMKINKTKLYENFIDIKNIANINLMGCYKVLFGINGIRNNIACFIIIPVILFHFLVIIIFYINQKKKIDKKIKKIIYGIKNWDLVQKFEKEKKRNETTNKIKGRNKKRNKNMLKTKNKKKKRITISLDEREEDNIIKNPPKKKKSLFNLINNNNSFINNINDMTKKNKEKENFNRNILNDDKTKNKEKKIKKIKKIMAFNDEEINNLSYKLALKFDKRNYCQYYLSLLKTNHIIFFSFFYNNDYNLRIIKIDLFFISFVNYYAVNALFFNDNTMHKIYEDQGTFNFAFQLPQIAYSSLISFVLDLLLKLLALSESNILNFKQKKEKINLDQNIKALNKILRIKFILYFIVSTILLLLFWYYLSMFCAIYRSTQYHLIKDTLISFGLSFIYPFGIYLLPGILRIPSLSNRKNKKEILYKISKLLQML